MGRGTLCWVYLCRLYCFWFFFGVRLKRPLRPYACMTLARCVAPSLCNLVICGVNSCLQIPRLGVRLERRTFRLNRRDSG